MSTILNRSQSALYVTDDSRMKDVLQLAATIVMASSVKTKVYDSKSLKTMRMKSLSDNFTLFFETDDEARNLFMKRQDM